ncbi:MAG: 50S ribosomal protein L3 [Candidatus Omnitrophica bacterium]|nr:50S ribosomal protein L3 [Candidatus Omnitrophota bacterium]MBU4457567.1 50S ribosomal protein L3 [Candidatus Omnitrophota bacterium]
MQIGILGKKLGMTQIFTEEGKFIPLTVVEAGPCTVLKAKEHRLTLGFGDRKEKSTPNPELAFYKKINSKPKAYVRDMAFDSDDKVSAGSQITVDIFEEKDFVDITGVSKGKGFQGGVRRWGWAGGPDSHGSMHHRRIGSVGGSSYPSRVWKGMHMPGRMGNKRRTVQNLEIIKVYKEKNLMLIKGPVPGANNGYLEIRSAKKRPIVREKAEKKEGKKE